MAEGDRLYRKAVRIDLAYPEAFVDWQNPTAAELNDGVFVKNITCSLNEDGTTISLGDPETDASMSFCDEAGIETPTIDNPEVVLEIFRNETNDRDEVAPFEVNNIAFDLLGHEDVPYIVILRVGAKDSDDVYTIGDRINMIGIRTDVPVDVYGNNEKIRLSNTGLPTGDINWRYKVLA